MSLVRIKDAALLGGFKVKLTLSDGTVIERNLEPLLRGRVFEKIRTDPKELAKVRVEWRHVGMAQRRRHCARTP